MRAAWVRSFFFALGGGETLPKVKLDKPLPLDPNKRNFGRPPKRETIIKYYQNNPDKWLENVFGVQLWEKQREILYDVWNNRYVAVKSAYAKIGIASCRERGEGS